MLLWWFRFDLFSLDPFLWSNYVGVAAFPSQPFYKTLLLKFWTHIALFMWTPEKSAQSYQFLAFISLKLNEFLINFCSRFGKKFNDVSIYWKMKRYNVVFTGISSGLIDYVDILMQWTFRCEQIKIVSIFQPKNEQKHRMQISVTN